MDAAQLSVERQEIIDRYGEWGSANIALPHGLFTIDATARGDNFRTHKFIQIISTLLPQPINRLRVLDLACGEGLYSVELAQQGAEVLGIEGRTANLAKADYARRAWNLQDLRFIEDDVRNFSAAKYGRFDVVLCSGILYHLDAPECFLLVEAIREACSGICIIDTRVASAEETTYTHRDKTYSGCIYREHNDDDSLTLRESRLGSSLDNVQSFWFTRLSLTNFLADTGYSLVFEVMAPVPWNTRLDRVTMVACTNKEVRPYNAIEPELNSRRWPLG